MNHSRIMATIITGFCIIFIGSVLGSISMYTTQSAQLRYSRDDISEDWLYIAIDRGLALTFVERLLQLIGGLILSVFSIVGAFVVENKYATVGLLLFSALVTVFVLAHTVFELTFVPTYYP